jgi:predicted transcriptional regulator
LFTHSRNMEDNKLKVIGYWHGFYEEAYPDPGSFVDDTWNAEEKERIVAYLKAAHEMPYVAGGLSWCRFRCGIVSLGNTEFTDGTYLWPAGLLHYVETHNVKLPREVLDHMLTNKKINTGSGKTGVDMDWWKGQTGPNTAIKTFPDQFDIGILTIAQVNDKMKAKQQYILRILLINDIGERRSLSAIDKILAGEEVQIKGRFDNINNLISKIKSIGLRGSFQYLTKEEYGDD